ncbi:MAG: type II toxin-antitoxin system RelE/ParE family toxin [Flammeovirgaceae bacterium]|nr:type II toxin-antitoxin system RelE/ParE family toxin [Flammeovirgaceae bacterium]
MAVEVKWTLQALDDIESIAAFIVRDSEYFALIQTEIFFSRAEILETFPLAGRVVPEQAEEVIRELIEGNYRIIYRVVSETRVDILTVHASQRLLSNNPVFKK